MNNAKTFLQLIRYKNLLIVALTQIVVYLCVYFKVETYQSNYFLLDIYTFILLVISTLLITAAGYIINDYFDIKIDAINRPQSALVAHFLHKKHALLLHIIFSLLGIMTAWLVAVKIGMVYLVSIQIVTVILLWFYSTHFKRMAYIGNIVVSMLTAMSIALIWIYNPALHKYITLQALLFNDMVNPFYLIIGISIFAFLLNWMREIIKDIEDYQGDEAHGCRTLPIVKGINFSKRLTQTIGIVTVAMLLSICAFLLYKGLVLYKVIILLIPIASILYINSRINKAISPIDFSIISKGLKWIMVQSLMIIVVFSF